MAKREAGNFYWGFISLGYHERMAIYALYNFARQVDDEADSVGIENLPARLAVHRERISRCVRGDYGDDPILRVLAEAVERYRFPKASCRCSSTAVEMDFSRSRYADVRRTAPTTARSSRRWWGGCACGSSALAIRSRSSAPTTSAWRCN